MCKYQARQFHGAAISPFQHLSYRGPLGPLDSGHPGFLWWGPGWGAANTVLGGLDTPNPEETPFSSAAD